MKILKTQGHDKRGKIINLYYGVFKVQGPKIIETVITNNYRTEKRARTEVNKKMKLYSNIINLTNLNNI